MSIERFHERVALVTGGASGIGRASALRLASEGARVCVADLDLAGAQAVAKEIVERGGEAFAIDVDVADADANDRMVAQTVERYGALHVAHLNAGIALPNSILHRDLETFDRVVAVNERSVYIGLGATAKAMIETAGGGSIVATASVAGLAGGGGMASYYATKHAVVGLVKAAATELAPHGVRVNAVCPGVIDTPILGPGHGVAEVTDALGGIHLLGRVGHPDEVAALVAFLASDDASFITGTANLVDGGALASIGAKAAAGAGDAKVGEVVQNLGARSSGAKPA